MSLKLWLAGGSVGRWRARHWAGENGTDRCDAAPPGRTARAVFGRLRERAATDAATGPGRTEPGLPFHRGARGADNSSSLFVVLTFSGGGTRAAALAHGVLEELAGDRDRVGRPSPPPARRGRLRSPPSPAAASRRPTTRCTATGCSATSRALPAPRHRSAVPAPPVQSAGLARACGSTILGPLRLAGRRLRRARCSAARTFGDLARRARPPVPHAQRHRHGRRHALRVRAGAVRPALRRPVALSVVARGGGLGGGAGADEPDHAGQSRRRAAAIPDAAAVDRRIAAARARRRARSTTLSKLRSYLDAEARPYIYLLDGGAGRQPRLAQPARNRVHAGRRVDARAAPGHRRRAQGGVHRRQRQHRARPALEPRCVAAGHRPGAARRSRTSRSIAILSRPRSCWRRASSAGPPRSRHSARPPATQPATTSSS
ncbi:MAG: DUF2457 domain-containing protein [Comamonadaceae bacterium]|nr:DUF2457 domain-containing protein [Comamonadaceae bacterium]